jgi:hypothetical protein
MLCRAALILCFDVEGGVRILTGDLLPQLVPRDFRE